MYPSLAVTSRDQPNLRAKDVLVTGGAGFIGSHLVDRLLDEDPASITVVDNFFLGRESNLSAAKSSGLTVHRLDASDLGSMRDLARRTPFDVVFDMATIPLPTSLQFPAWTTGVITGIANTLSELARWEDIGTLVHASSSEAYGSGVRIPMDEDHPLRPTTPYAAAKSAADQIVLSYVSSFAIDAVVVRPFNTFGPRQNAGSYAGIIPIVIERVRRGEPIEIFGDGLQTRDFSYVTTVVDAFVRIHGNADSRGLAVNVATGVETSINDLVHRLLSALDASEHPVVHTDPRPGDVRRHSGDITLAASLIGLEPRPISDAQLEETVAWYARSE